MKENEEISLYEIDTNGKINKNKVKIVIILVLTAIFLVITLIYSINSIKRYEVYKKYETQLLSIKEEEELKKKKEAEELEKKRQEKIPKLTNIGKQNIEKIYNCDTKRVFLTFDDGPSMRTNEILDILKEENIKATFFVLGNYVEKMPETVKRIYDEGHYIANHGYSHVYEQIYSSPQAVLDEYNKCNEAIKNAIGVPEYNSHLFRFPGGLVGGKYADIKLQAKELLNQNNILNVDWNALIGDSEKANASTDFLLQRLKDTVGNKSSPVILMHDAPAKKSTVEALPQIISYLKEQGYEFKNFYEIIK